MGEGDYRRENDFINQSRVNQWDKLLICSSFQHRCALFFNFSIRKCWQVLGAQIKNMACMAYSSDLSEEKLPTWRRKAEKWVPVALCSGHIFGE